VTIRYKKKFLWRNATVKTNTLYWYRRQCDRRWIITDVYTSVGGRDEGEKNKSVVNASLAQRDFS